MLIRSSCRKFLERRKYHSAQQSIVDPSTLWEHTFVANFDALPLVLWRRTNHCNKSRNKWFEERALILCARAEVNYYLRQTVIHAQWKSDLAPLLFDTHRCCLLLLWPTLLCFRVLSVSALPYDQTIRPVYACINYNRTYITLQLHMSDAENHFFSEAVMRMYYYEHHTNADCRPLSSF